MSGLITGRVCHGLIEYFDMIPDFSAGAAGRCETRGTLASRRVGGSGAPGLGLGDSQLLPIECQGFFFIFFFG